MSTASVPEHLGRYRILSKLGEGGMGAVYLAEDTVLSRRVAVKVPRFSASEGRAVIERFQREARTAASIDHPNICAVHDFGEVDGLHYLVMPFIEGRPLSELIDEDNPWPPARAAALVRQLALAMEVLHQRGLIHRDLKPSNVLLRPNGEPVLMDFGLARSYTEQTRRLTQTGAALGTPAYMAPEQILGDAKVIGPATDIYEMGVILYELLTGHLPFEGPPAAVYGQILHAQTAPPSALRPGLDATLDAVCLKALAKKPAERFASMTAFAEALVPWACPVAVVSEPTIPALSEAPSLIEPPQPRRACPGCGKSLKVPATATGKRLKCPRCQTILAAAAVTQQRSPPNRADVDTAAPSVLKTEAAPPPRPVPQRGTRAPLVLSVVGVALLVCSLSAWLLLRESKPAVANAPGKVADDGTRPPAGKQTPVKKPNPPNQKPPDTKPAEKAPPPRVVASLRLLPLEAVTLEPGQGKRIALKVERRNCPGPIEVKLADGPPGVSASNGLVGNDGDNGTVTVAVAKGTKAGSHTLRLLAVAAAARAEGELRLTIHEAQPAELRNTIGMEFVRIKPGTFLMGSPDGKTPPGVPAEEKRQDDETPHEVTLTKGYYLGKYLVTQQQWEEVMGKDANHSHFKGTTGEQKKTLPVDNVSWFDCVEFCIKLSEKENRKPHYRLTDVERNDDGSIKAAKVEMLTAGTGYRLPTEAEWEYACRAGTGTAFWWGNSITTDQANYDGNFTYGKDGKKGEYRQKTTPVDRFEANKWGLHDMHGNLYQWCQDWYGKDYYEKSDKKDPQGPDGGTARVLRGGCWRYNPGRCRAADRNGNAPAIRDGDYGCRLLLRLD